MQKEVKTVLKKTVKIAGATCVAMGAVALITSGAALKAFAEGGKYLADTVKRILKEEPAEEAVVEEVVAEEVETVPEEASQTEETQEETPQTDAPAEEENV